LGRAHRYSVVLFGRGNVQHNMRKKLLLSIAPLLALVSVHAVAQEQLLRDAFVGKAFYLRNFYSDDSLRYDESGQPKHSSPHGHWTTSQFAIDKAECKDDHFDLIGRRVALAFDRKEDKVTFYNLGRLQVRVDRDKGSITPEVIDQLKQAMFVDLKTEPEQVPEYWRDLVTGNVEAETKDGHKVYSLKNKPWKVTASTNPDRLSTAAASADLVYKIGPDVHPPKAISTPDPEYPEIARKMKYEGSTILWTIVNENGLVSDIRILRPAGFGLDENAVASVKRWKFHPATRGDKPVKVQMVVEVSFSLGEFAR
jgi:TonB family protein